VQPQVVPVERDVERADRHVEALESVDAGGQPAGQGNTAGRDAEQDRAGRSGGLLEDLVRYPVDHPVQVGGGKNSFTVVRLAREDHSGPPSPPHWTGR
jgi:hypothetical protein